MLTKGKKTMDFHILDSFILWEKCQNDACVCPRVQQERLSAVFALHYQMNLSAVRGASASASAAEMLIYGLKFKVCINATKMEVNSAGGLFAGFWNSLSATTNTAESLVGVCCSAAAG